MHVETQAIEVWLDPAIFCVTQFPSQDTASRNYLKLIGAYPQTAGMNRVCFISLSAYGYFNENAPSGGGAQRQFYFISKGITDAFDVHFIVGDYGQKKIEYREGVTLHRSYPPDSSASGAKRLKHLIQLWGAMRRVDADIYVTRCPPKKLNILFILTRIMNKPIVYHIATDKFVDSSIIREKTLTSRIYKAAINNSIIVSQTRKQQKLLEENWDVKSIIIPNGYPQAPVVNLYDKREYFLWVGRLDKTEKRPHIFLDLADKIPSEEFVMIGPSGNDDDYSNQIIQRASDATNVEYIGQVEPSKIHKYFRQAIAVINTSHEQYEGFPNTFLESWRVGTPVLSLDIDMNRFFVKSVETSGYANNDFDTLVSLLHDFADYPERRKNLGIFSMETFNKQYEIEIVINSYRKLIKECV